MNNETTITAPDTSPGGATLETGVAHDPAGLAAKAQTIPPVECTPWCEYGDGHIDATEQGDQVCYSHPTEFELISYPMIELFGGVGYYRDRIIVTASKSAQHIAGSVIVEQSTAGDVLNLSRSEALALSDALRVQAELL